MRCAAACLRSATSVFSQSSHAFARSPLGFSLQIGVRLRLLLVCIGRVTSQSINTGVAKAPWQRTRLPLGAYGLSSTHSSEREAAPTGVVSRILLVGPAAAAVLRLAGCAVCAGGERLFRGGIVAWTGSGGVAAAVDAVVSPLMPGLAVCTGGVVPFRGGIVAWTGSGGGAAVDAVVSPLIPGLAVCTGGVVPPPFRGGKVPLAGWAVGTAAAASPESAGPAVWTGRTLAGFADAAAVAGWVVGVMALSTPSVAVCVPVAFGGTVASAMGVLADACIAAGPCCSCRAPWWSFSYIPQPMWNK